MVTTDKPKQKVPSEQEFLLALKTLINKIYQDGVEEFLDWDIQGESIIGTFRDGTKVFDFTLDESGLDYGPSGKGAKQVMDSVLSNYPFLEGENEAYIKTFLESFRKDNKKNCTSPTAYSCGNSCINNKKRCQIKGNSIAAPEQIKSVVEAGKQVKESGGKGTARQQVSPFSGAMGKAGAIAAGAALLGVPVASFVAIRNNYRKGYEESKNQAIEMARTIDVPDLSDEKTHITFATGGFAEDGKGGERLSKSLQELGLTNHHITAIGNEEFNIIDPGEVSNRPNDKDIGIAELVLRANRTFFRTSVIQGRNPVAVKIAAQGIAYKQKYPDRQINLIGHSAGGLSSREAAEILELAGIKVKMVAIGSPWLGMTEPTENNITFASNKDYVIQSSGYSVMNGAWVNGVKGHQIKAYFEDEEFKTLLKNHLDDQTTRKDSNSKNLKNQQQFILLLRTILERSYSDGITRFVDIEISDNGDVSGLFRDGNKLIDFNITDNNITTKLSKQRKDSYHEIRYLRWDAGKRRVKKSQCGSGLSCGNTCISSNKVCRIGSNKLASPQELSQLKKLASQVKTPGGAAPAEDPLDKMTIRELKKEAKDRDIYMYSRMTSEQLKSAIRVYDQDGPQQDRVRKGLEKKKIERETYEKTKIGSYSKSWKQFEKIVKVAGLKSDVAITALTIAMIGTTYKVYNDMRSHYRDGLKESAETATARAEKINVPIVRRSNITFTVGGFKSDGSTGEEIKKQLQEADDWYKKSHEIISFDSDDFDVPPSPIPKKNADGTYNIAYLGYMATQGFGASLRNFYKQRNEGSVELASQIYAYANAVRKKDGKIVPINRDKPINIVAHGAGGLTAREAIDIIASMPNGREVLRRINLISMGTPDFGFTEKTLDREMTITGNGDPWSLFPTRKEKRIPSVSGHEIEDYMKNDNAIEQISRFLGKGRTSTYYEEQRLRKEKAEARREKRRNSRPRRGNPQENTEGRSDSYKQGYLLALSNR